MIGDKRIAASLDARQISSRPSGRSSMTFEQQPTRGRRLRPPTCVGDPRRRDDPFRPNSRASRQTILVGPRTLAKGRAPPLTFRTFDSSSDQRPILGSRWSRIEEGDAAEAVKEKREKREKRKKKWRTGPLCGPVRWIGPLLLSPFQYGQNVGSGGGGGGGTVG